MALQAQKAGIQRLLPEHLQNIPVPVADPERITTLGELAGIEGAPRGKAAEIGADRPQLSDAGNARGFRTRLDRLRRRGKLLSISMQSLESLDHQIAAT